MRLPYVLPSEELSLTRKPYVKDLFAAPEPCGHPDFMKRFTLLWLAAAFPFVVLADKPVVATGDPWFENYFRFETATLQQKCLSGIRSLDEWRTNRDEYRRELREMLGLWPMPERTELKPVVTGKLEREDFVVEKLYFQASPRLYVTANLYLPKNLPKPAPGILYVCGHARVVTNGVSCGNKLGYQHHGAWFARNGYVCLLIDTLQLGEIEGMHHGTYREGQWWWNSRGYTPAGIEAWFGIRALDYLCSRPEVDKERVGMTGRSGGGSYTWTVAALDERVKVAAPIAGMTDLCNQIVDGAVEGHCDCMFFVNTYRWDFPQVAALIAPRPLLIGNSDKDTIFPLDGVVRLHEKTRRIYQLYGAADHLGLLITEGPHADTQDLQVPVFRWFNRFLKGEQPLIEMAAKPFFAPQELRVFDQIPTDELNTKIQESFVPKAAESPKAALEEPGAREKLVKELREKVFGGWPDRTTPMGMERSSQQDREGLRYEVYNIDSQPGINLQLFVFQDKKIAKPQTLVLEILASHTNSPSNPFWNGWSPEGQAQLQHQLKNERSALAFFSPRGVDTEEWMRDQKKAIQVRRRYMLLGQTLDSMRVWDIRCAVQALKELPQFRDSAVCVRSQGEMGVNAAYAALFEPSIARLDLAQLPKSHMQGPDYLNVLKVTDIPQVIELLSGRVHCDGD
jgi:dienelactone hydrolase